MEKKTKVIIIGLAVILLVSLFIDLQIYLAKRTVEEERDGLKKENAALAQKGKELLQKNDNLQKEIYALEADLDRINRSKEDLQQKFELLNKERQELVKKLQSQMKAAPAAPAAPRGEATLAEDDSYWAGILKAKTDLEMRLGSLREQLKTLQINSEQMEKDKSVLELEISNLRRDRDDLKRQLGYNQKIMDSIAQELVREKNDKFQIEASLKVIRNENILMRRQLNSLNIRKSELDHKVVDLKKQKMELENKLGASEANLRNNIVQLDNLKGRLEAVQTGKPVPEDKKEAVELAPIVVRPQTELQETPIIPLEGKILAVNRDNNFVIIDLGQDSGLKIGDTFQVHRDDKIIANLEVVQLQPNIAACDIKKENISIQIGDVVK